MEDEIENNNNNLNNDNNNNDNKNNDNKNNDNKNERKNSFISYQKNISNK